eukprot:scaffold152122_cov18-Tisochrysis_lutea.AAC.1
MWSALSNFRCCTQDQNPYSPGAIMAQTAGLRLDSKLCPVTCVSVLILNLLVDISEDWVLSPRASAQRSSTVAFLSMVPISRLRLLGRTSNFEGLMRISSDQRVAVYTMELSEG